MEIIIGLIGFIFGLFLWASILGTLLYTFPMLKQLKYSPLNKDMGYQVIWLKEALPILLPALVLLTGLLFVPEFFIGTLPALVLMSINLKGLRKEAVNRINSRFKVSFI